MLWDIPLKDRKAFPFLWGIWTSLWSHRNKPVQQNIFSSCLWLEVYMRRMPGDSKAGNTPARILHLHSQSSHLFVLAQAIVKLCCDQGLTLSRIIYGQKKLDMVSKKKLVLTWLKSLIFLDTNSSMLKKMDTWSGGKIRLMDPPDQTTMLWKTPKTIYL